MRQVRTFVIAAAAIGALFVAASPPAHADWHWRHGPRGWIRFWGPPVVVAPPPVYYAPPPAVVYAPPPVYYAPPPVAYVAPPLFGIGIHIH